MSDHAPADRRLSRERITDLLTELGVELARRGLRADLFLVGGAAMALAYNTRRITADVDAVFEPKDTVYEAARRVAQRHGDLPPDWLNDGVKGFLPGPDPAAKVLLDAPGVRVHVASARYPLALKVHAARVDRDPDDIRVLARQAGARTAEEVLAIAAEVMGPGRLTARAQFMVQEMFGPDGQELDP